MMGCGQGITQTEARHRKGLENPCSRIVRSRIPGSVDRHMRILIIVAQLAVNLIAQHHEIMLHTNFRDLSKSSRDAVAPVGLVENSASPPGLR